MVGFNQGSQSTQTCSKHNVSIVNLLTKILGKAQAIGESTHKKAYKSDWTEEGHQGREYNLLGIFSKLFLFKY